MTVFGEPCPWGFFISYIIYSWPRWSHIFWTYILSPQKVKIKTMFIHTQKKNLDQSCTALFFPNILLRLINLLANWKKVRLILLQDINQISDFTKVACLCEGIHLSPAFWLAASKLSLKKKRLREKYNQAIFQSNISVSTVPEFKISLFKVNNLELPWVKGLPFFVGLKSF